MPRADHFFTTTLTYEPTPSTPTTPTAGPETVTSINWSTTGVSGKIRGGELVTLTAVITTSRGRTLPAEFDSVFSNNAKFELRAEAVDKRSITVRVAPWAIDITDGTTITISGRIVNDLLA